MKRTLLALAMLTVACERAPATRPTDPAVTGSPSVVEPRDDADEIPCAPRRVLVKVCQQCHTRPTANGAPFPLQRRSDLFATYGEVEIRELMVEEITTRRMPLAPVTIENGDRETLLVWLENGAPAAAPSTCAEEP